MGGVGCLRHLASSSISVYILHDENTTQNDTPQNQNATQSQNAAETAICDRYAARSGSDGARGPDRPRTVQKLVDSLSAGQVGCLRGGLYTDPDKRLLFDGGGKMGHRMVLRSHPAEFRGSIHIRKGSDHVTPSATCASTAPTGP